MPRQRSSGRVGGGLCDKRERNRGARRPRTSPSGKARREVANHHHVTTHLTDSQRSTSKMIARTEKWISMSEFHNSARAWVLRFAATMTSTSGIVVAVTRGPSLALACGSGRASSRRCVRTPLLAPCMTRRRRVPSQNSHRLAASGDGNDGDDSVSATAGDTRQDDGLDNDTYHPYETQSTYEEESTNEKGLDMSSWMLTKCR